MNKAPVETQVNQQQTGLIRAWAENMLFSQGAYNYIMAFQKENKEKWGVCPSLVASRLVWPRHTSFIDNSIQEIKVFSTVSGHF